MQIQVFEPKDKQKQVLELLKFDTIMVFIDARNENVKVPESLKAQFDLRLNFDYEFGINDFRVLPDRIEASLSFAEGEFFCVIPFEAVYLILCQAVNRGCLFVETVPNEMLDFFFDSNNPQLTQAPKRSFTVIENNNPEPAVVAPAKKKSTKKKATASESENAEADSKPKTGKSHLRLVK